MAQYLYTNDYMHCSCERCPQHEKCWRFELWIMCEGKESHYLPDEHEDLAKCEFFIDKEKYKIK